MVPYDEYHPPAGGRERLIAIEPWSAAGPGWANSGISMLIEDGTTGRVRLETVYRHDLTGRAAVLFPHLLAMYGEVRTEVERAWKEGRWGHIYPESARGGRKG